MVAATNELNGRKWQTLKTIQSILTLGFENKR